LGPDLVVGADEDDVHLGARLLLELLHPVVVGIALPRQDPEILGRRGAAHSAATAASAKATAGIVRFGSISSIVVTSLVVASAETRLKGLDGREALVRPGLHPVAERLAHDRHVDLELVARFRPDPRHVAELRGAEEMGVEIARAAEHGIAEV